MHSAHNNLELVCLALIRFAPRRQHLVCQETLDGASLLGRSLFVSSCRFLECSAYRRGGLLALFHLIGDCKLVGQEQVEDFSVYIPSLASPESASTPKQKHSLPSRSDRMSQ